MNNFETTTLKPNFLGLFIKFRKLLFTCEQPLSILQTMYIQGNKDGSS